MDSDSFTAGADNADTDFELGFEFCQGPPVESEATLMWRSSTKRSLRVFQEWETDLFGDWGRSAETQTNTGLVPHLSDTFVGSAQQRVPAGGSKLHLSHARHPSRSPQSPS